MQELIRELTWLLTDNLLVIVVTPRILMEVTREISGRGGGG